MPTGMKKHFVMVFVLVLYIEVDTTAGPICQVYVKSIPPYIARGISLTCQGGSSIDMYGGPGDRWDAP